MKRSIYTKYFSSEYIGDFLFPVGKHNIYFDMAKPLNEKDVPFSPREPVGSRKFMAVVDEERRHMLECVSRSYTLISNEWACDRGFDIAKKIFRISDENDIAFWFGYITEDRGACEMNFHIRKDIKIGDVENVWHAFLHIENSYNRSSPLSYQVGFHLETMDNREIPLGILIPSLSLEFSANHGWSIDKIRNKLDEAVYEKYPDIDVFSEFEMMVKELMAIPVVDDEILPLFCRLTGIKKLNEEDPKDIYLANILIMIDDVADRWIKMCKMNAYAALCTYADFVSRYSEEVKTLFKEPSEYQSQLGKLMDELIIEHLRKGKEFSLYRFIGEEAQEVKKQIKLYTNR